MASLSELGDHLVVEIFVRDLDLSIAKEFRWGQNQALDLRFDVMNVFNRDVDNAYEGNFYNANFGKATGADPNLTRRFQIGARYSF